jgi:hypothetical protein
MVFRDSGSLLINGLVVDDFDYLLSYLTNEKLDTFRNLEKIAGIWPVVESAAASELLKPILREEESLNISHTTAINNVENILIIVKTISEYVAECNRLSLPINVMA